MCMIFQRRQKALLWSKGLPTERTGGVHMDSLRGIRYNYYFLFKIHQLDISDHKNYCIWIDMQVKLMFQIYFLPYKFFVYDEV